MVCNSLFWFLPSNCCWYLPTTQAIIEVICFTPLYCIYINREKLSGVAAENVTDSRYRFKFCSFVSLKDINLAVLYSPRRISFC